MKKKDESSGSDKMSGNNLTLLDCWAAGLLGWL